MKRIRGLHSRKERRETGLFFAEGVRTVAEAVELGAPIDSLVLAPDLLTSDFGWEVVERAHRQGISRLEVSGPVFASISVKDGPQGLGAVVRQRWERLDDIQSGDEFCWIALDSIQDPGNLGTIMRTSDAVGGAGIILLGQSTDPHDPAALRASMGAIFSQRLVRATFPELVQWRTEHSYTLIGTSDASPLDYRSADYPPRRILLMGSERDGLSQEQQRMCDVVARIPMVGRSDSLNLSVAAGVMLYELFGRR